MLTRPTVLSLAAALVALSPGPAAALVVPSQALTLGLSAGGTNNIIVQYERAITDAFSLVAAPSVRLAFEERDGVRQVQPSLGLRLGGCGYLSGHVLDGMFVEPFAHVGFDGIAADGSGPGGAQEAQWSLGAGAMVGYGVLIGDDIQAYVGAGLQYGHYYANRNHQVLNAGGLNELVTTLKLGIGPAF